MHLRSVRTMMSIKNDIEIHDVCIMIGGSQDSGSAVAKSVCPAQGSGPLAAPSTTLSVTNGNMHPNLYPMTSCTRIY